MHERVGSFKQNSYQKFWKNPKTFQKPQKLGKKEMNAW